MSFFENYVYFGGSQKEWVAFLAIVLHSECEPLYPVYTTLKIFQNIVLEKS